MGRAGNRVERKKKLYDREKKRPGTTGATGRQKEGGKGKKA